MSHHHVMLVGLAAWSVLLALAVAQLAAEARYQRRRRRVCAVPQAAPHPALTLPHIRRAAFVDPQQLTPIVTNPPKDSSP